MLARLDKNHVGISTGVGPLIAYHEPDNSLSCLGCVTDWQQETRGLFLLAVYFWWVANRQICGGSSWGRWAIGAGPFSRKPTMPWDSISPWKNRHASRLSRRNSERFWNKQRSGNRRSFAAQAEGRSAVITD